MAHSGIAHMDDEKPAIGHWRSRSAGDAQHHLVHEGSICGARIGTGNHTTTRGDDRSGFGHAEPLGDLRNGALGRVRYAIGEVRRRDRATEGM
jgi:hypothetical protein